MWFIVFMVSWLVVMLGFFLLVSSVCCSSSVFFSIDVSVILDVRCCDSRCWFGLLCSVLIMLCVMGSDVLLVFCRFLGVVFFVLEIRFWSVCSLVLYFFWIRGVSLMLGIVFVLV